jgi:hypothetical protein
MPRRARAAAYDPVTRRYTGQRAANDPWLAKLMESGREFWASRGVQLPERIALDIADDLSGPDEPDGSVIQGRAWSPQDHGEARVALNAAQVRQALRTGRSRERTTRERREALKRLSGQLLHEMGHTGGVPHKEGDEGFMGAGGAGLLVPQETARVIRRLAPRRSVKIKRGPGPGRGSG